VIHNTAAILVEQKGKILLVKRLNRTFRGWWCVPGGHAEPGESPEQAAQREANEEVGDVKIEGKPFMVFSHDWPPDNHIKKPHQHRCHAFRGRVSGEIIAGSDAGEFRWFTLEEAKKLKLTNYTETILKTMFKN
jgi:8-oxo-dGTP diphosphatase